MLKEIEFTDVMKESIEQLTKGGAFLTTCYDGKINTMTIGWASAGIMWGKKILTVAVRYSRHSYNKIDNAQEFTVSFPAKGELAKELAVCGSKSGRDTDKFQVCNLKPQESLTINTPVIDKCKIHFECKVVYKQAMEPGLVSKDIKDRFYKSNNDYHVLYYGEITSCYISE